MTKIDYVVTTATMDEVTVEAIVDGKKVQAKVQRLVVEATSRDGSMGHTFRFGADVNPDDFAVGDKVTATFAPTKSK